MSRSMYFIEELLLIAFASFFIQLPVTADVEELLPLSNGSCSRKCQSTVASGAEQQNSSADAFSLYQCSCSQSCKLYGDCCYDSEHRPEGNSRSRTRMMCLTLSGKGQYKAVASCARNWPQPSEYCINSIGFLPPVTSKKSGITYANIHCAICNYDTELTTWNVELRCCDDYEDYEEHRYIYRNGYLWNVVRGISDPRNPTCLCKYQTHENDYSFLDSLELRYCDEAYKISRCSPSWSNTSVERLCRSYLDPVYSTDKIYRNRHCAECNYETAEAFKCKPKLVELLESGGSNSTEIFELCRQRADVLCLSFFKDFYRGTPYAFSNLLNINEKSCIPQSGKRCCAGQRYDFRAKRCRDLL